MRWITFAAAMALWTAGTLLACSDPSGELGTLVLGWTFIDGRTCADSGVERVVATIPGEQAPLVDTLCNEGYGAPLIRASLDSGERRVQVAGFSAAETMLYSKKITVTIEPGQDVDRVVELVFTGGQ